jgi:hypothetical protein
MLIPQQINNQLLDQSFLKYPAKVIRADAYKFAVRIEGYGLNRLRKYKFRREAGVSTPA